MTRTLILGNGFDLFLGLKSSFQDYLKSEHFRQLSEENNLKAFCHKQLQDDENWSDLENGIRNWITNIRFPLVAHLDRQNNSRAEDVRELRRHFKDFKSSIHNFISSAYRDWISQNPNGEKLVESWVRKRDLCVYNFNYTTTFIEIAADLGYELKQNVFEHHFVHGNLIEDNIIFGSQDYSVPTGLGFTLKAGNAGFSPPNLKGIVNDSKVIHVFGHSLGDSDSSYFSDLFNEYMAQNLGFQKLVIFTKDEESEEGLRERIATLINYQSTRLHQRNYPPQFIRMDDHQTGFAKLIEDSEFFS